MRKSKLIRLGVIPGLVFMTGYLAGREWGRSERIVSPIDTVAPASRLDSGHTDAPPGEGFQPELLRERARHQLVIGRMSAAQVHRRLAEVRAESRPGFDYSLLRLLWRRLAETDAAGAVEAAWELPDGLERSLALSTVINSWAADRPEEAWDWVQATVTDPFQREDQQAILFGQMIEQGRADLALMKFREMPAEHQALAAYLLSGLLPRYEPERTVELMDLLPPGTVRDRVVQRFIRTWAENEPAAAASWIVSQQDPDTRGPLLVSVLTSWAAEGDPAQAVQWVRSLPPSLQTDHSKAIVAANSVRAHTDQAVALAFEIQDQNLRKEAFSGMIFNLAFNADPGRARELLERLPPGTASDSSISQVADALKRRDPLEAENFVRTSPSLNEEQRKTLLERLFPDRQP